MRGLRTWPPAAPFRAWLQALICDSELTEHGELLGVVDVASFPSKSPTGEAPLSANEVEVKGMKESSAKRKSLFSQ